ncbi:MAG: hypothetical protein HKP59_02370 [Lutibacter sp.]|uniref:hypothetical protein n=1 Tax=Lutibacter sp. TaxID=1925666 RepID=UPI001850AE70|nr:hypothetical protein [Lutibacter sp.]MBT8316449.1 hypothetical protein [Lutibacter sp.]NNJ57309.1 hypothetical protein [Lutibacter sp.]
MHPTLFQENYLKELLAEIMNKNNKVVNRNDKNKVKKYIINTLSPKFNYKNNKGEIVAPKNNILF